MQSHFQEIREPVDVLSSTEKQRLIKPHLVVWKGRNFTIAKILSRKKHRQRKSVREELMIEVLALKRMLIEYDYTKKSWTLLGIEEEPF